jgi:hypothetical protein
MRQYALSSRLSRHNLLSRIGRGECDLHAPHADRDLSTDLQEFQPNGTAVGARSPDVLILFENLGLAAG